jgi:hypothetical protein
MQFSDSAGKFACGAQFCTYKELQPLCFIMVFSYLKVLLVCSSKLARIHRKNPLLSLNKVIFLLLLIHSKGKQITFYKSSKSYLSLLANFERIIEYTCNLTGFACGAPLPFTNLPTAAGTLATAG